jgi:stress response protein YsnF
MIPQDAGFSEQPRSSAVNGRSPAPQLHSNTAATPASAVNILPADAVVVLPVLREEASVEKVREVTGRVRVRKLVHTQDETVPAKGYQEIVETRRVPVNQAVDFAQSSRNDGDVLVIPVYEERVVKQLFLVEEIHLTRRRQPVETESTVEVRREEAVVERFDVPSGLWVVQAP